MSDVVPVQDAEESTPTSDGAVLSRTSGPSAPSHRGHRWGAGGIRGQVGPRDDGHFVDRVISGVQKPERSG